MINETSDSPFPTSGASTLGGTGTGMGSTSTVSSTGTSSFDAADTQGTVHRMAQKAHDAVDRLEQTLGSGSERMMDWQQEYGDMAREQVRANPLAAVGIAFAVGIVFNKLFMR